MAAQATGRVLLKLLLVVMIVSVSSAEQQEVGFVDEPMLARLAEQHGEQARRRGEALNVLLQELAGKDVKQQLREVNRFFNQFQYKEDIEVWGQKDYWATPEEFIGLNRGDCEDFVVAKYFVLRSLGVPDEQLYLTYVKAVRKNVAHMVLSYFSTPKSVPLILDNYNQKILPETQRRDLLPVYSVNAGSLFLTNASAGLGRALPTDRIKNNKWQKLLANVKRARP